ncbi:class I SAM-dependent methyltransferase [Pelagibacteraceae bacterium]|nr:class I SAM-dependent methyltransferase [Pelagibacteraceae bacterium]
MLRKSLKYLLDDYNNEKCDERINILEIGVYAGGSTLQICNFLKKNKINNFKIYCVDHWKKFSATQEKKWSFHEYILNKGLDSGKIFKIFNNNIKFSGFSENIQTIVGSSKESLKKIDNIKFDFAYIDGGHSYSIVKSDIEESISLLKEKSFISGDDYEISYEECDQEKIKENIRDEKLDFCLDPKSKKVYHPGVTMAINELFGNIPSYNGFWIQKKINNKFENVNL